MSGGFLRFAAFGGIKARRRLKFDHERFLGIWMMKSMNIKSVLGVGIILILTAGIAHPIGIDAAPTYKPIDIIKRALNTSGNEILSVDRGQRIIYEICFVNNNDSALTGVSLVDEIPYQVDFVEAHIGNVIGVYNSTERTFTWLYGNLEAGESACLEIVVDVKEDATLNTIISNFVWIKCNEATPSSSVLDLPLGVTLVRLDNVSISPDAVAPGETGKDITATLEFPAGISQSDIDPNDEPALYYQLRSSNEFVLIDRGVADLAGTESKPVISITFDLEKLMSVLSGTGQFNLRIKGKLKSGEFYYGDVTIEIISEQEPPGNASIDVYMENIWDYNDPADDSDLTYEFRLRIELGGIDSVLEKNVTGVEFLTPAGKTFQIPKKAGQWWGNIWTSYEYDAEWDWATWEYTAKSTKLADLKLYGDGQYTFTITYKDGSKDQASAWFGIPGTTDPIPQPTQEPVLSFPQQDQTAESPVTFTWKPCTDANVSEIGLQMRELEHDDFKEGYVDAGEIKWGPVVLTDGSWQAELIFEQTAVDTSQLENNVFFSFSKSSRSRYDFTTTGYPRNTYEVWGGEIFLDEYSDIDEIEANGYVMLGKTDGENATFSGEYTYYLIAARGQFAIDSIQGPDDTYYYSFAPGMRTLNIKDENYLLGPPDGQYAIVGTGSPLFEDDYSGYIAFSNPGKWKELTVIAISDITPAAEPVEVQSLSITPNVMRRNGSGNHITAAFRFPQGITQSDIDPDDQPALYYQDRDTNQYILIGKASSVVMSGTEDRPAITARFSRSELMNKVPYYGGVNLKIEGKLNGQTYYGFATIHITIFAGD
jgi:hypothetical protein